MTDLLYPPRRLQFACYKAGASVEALDAPLGKVDLDRGKMSASAIFCTENRDRQGDVIRVGGIYTGNHQKNPVVMLDHGQKQFWTEPIGVTRDPDGNYTVVIDEEMGEATQTTYFSQRLKPAVQIFGLIDEGVIGGNSIGFRPIDVRRLPPDPQLNYPGGKFINTSDLLEVTWCAVPVNPECVTIVLDRGRVGGEELEPMVKSMLLPYALPHKVWSPGADLGKKAMSALDDTAGGALRPEPETRIRKGAKPMKRKAVSPGHGEGEIDEETGRDDGLNKKVKALDDGASGSGEGEVSEETGHEGLLGKVKSETDLEGGVGHGEGEITEEVGPDEGLNEDVKAEPLGATTMRQLHHDLHQLHKAYSKDIHLIEHPQTSKHLRGFLDGVHAHIGKMEEHFAQHYPEHEPLKAMDIAAEEEAAGGGLEREDEAAEHIGGKSLESVGGAVERDLEHREHIGGKKSKKCEAQSGLSKPLPTHSKKSFTPQEQEQLHDIKADLEEAAQHPNLPRAIKALLQKAHGSMHKMCGAKDADMNGSPDPRSQESDIIEEEVDPKHELDAREREEAEPWLKSATAEQVSMWKSMTPKQRQQFSEGAQQVYEEAARLKREKERQATSRRGRLRLAEVG